jgi:hypothetical protein
VQDGELAGMRTRNRLEFQQTFKFALVRALIFEFMTKDDFDRAQGARSAIAREPDFAVAAASDSLEQIVVGNPTQPVKLGRTWTKLIVPMNNMNCTN